METPEIINDLSNQRVKASEQNEKKRLEAAVQELELLKRQQSVLESTLNDLQFSIDELKCERAEKEKMLEENEPEVEHGAFFKILTQLENREVELQEKIKEQKKIYADLMHEQSIVQQKNKKLQKELETQKVHLHNDEMNSRTARDKLDVLTTEIIEKENEYHDLCELAEQLEQELVQKSEENKNANENLNENLKKQRDKLIVDLIRRQAEENDMKNKIIQTERECAARKKQQEREIKKAESINEWKIVRQKLNTIIIKSKKKLNDTLKSLESTRNKETALRAKFKELLGEDDPGDGTGQMARRMLQAEIQRLSNLPDDEYEQDLAVEREYYDSLKRQIEILENSIKKFEGYRTDILSSLDEELIQASNDGYVCLLKQDLQESIQMKNGNY